MIIEINFQILQLIINQIIIIDFIINLNYYSIMKINYCCDYLISFNY